MRRLLSEDGSIFVHIGPGMSSYVKFLLDEIFGADRYLNEIIWRRRLGQSQSERRRFGAVTDSIFWYSKTEQYIFVPQFTKEGAEDYIRERYTHLTPDDRRFKLGDLSNPDYRPTLMYTYKGYPPPKKGWAVSLETMEKMDREGRIHFPTKPGGQLMRRQFLDEWKGKPIQSIWEDIPPINSQAKERLGFETQKPEPLLERIIKTATKDPEVSKNEDHKITLVADFFCGSGTTAAVAEKLGRRWITTDLSKTAIQVTRARLVNQNATPFLIQNLGNYQRQLIYMRDVKLKEMYNIILKLYGAVPREDLQGFGIKQDDKNALVFVCEPDRPMTARKALELAKQAHLADGKGYRKLVILAWDYELDFDNDWDRLRAAKKEIAECEFKVIPSDVLKYLRKTGVNGGSLADRINFYQKPYLRMGEPAVRQRDGETVDVQIKMENYVVWDIPLKDDNKRPEIQAVLAKNFASLIDYWTVDWNYDSEVFRSTWQAMRDRKKSEPVPTVADANLKRGKRYTIAVRVVDVFGNDASVTKELDLRG